MEQVDGRDKEEKREKVCLLDGERGLWSLVLSLLTGMVYILNIFHTMEGRQARALQPRSPA
ncbi:MAG: hypothetical protein ACE5JO_07140 [Candidatus Binatia bacterium]